MINFEDGFAADSGDVPAYLFEPLTGEYLGAGSVSVLAGFGLPAGAALEAPPVAPDGQIAVRQDDSWVLMSDHRGMVYSTNDGAPVQFRELGDLPDTLTLLPRPGPAYAWGGADWVLDAALDMEIKTRDELHWIEQELAQSGKEICKHEDQDPQATSTEQAWRTYRIELRAWPLSELFPNVADRPLTPIGEQP